MWLLCGVWKSIKCCALVMALIAVIMWPIVLCSIFKVSAWWMFAVAAYWIIGAGAFIGWIDCRDKS